MFTRTSKWQCNFTCFPFSSHLLLCDIHLVVMYSFAHYRGSLQILFFGKRLCVKICKFQVSKQTREREQEETMAHAQKKFSHILNRNNNYQKKNENPIRKCALSLHIKNRNQSYDRNDAISISDDIAEYRDFVVVVDCCLHAGLLFLQEV